MPVKELIFSKTVGLEPNTLEKKDFFFEMLISRNNFKIGCFPSQKQQQAGFDLSFGSAAMKVYPLIKTLSWRTKIKICSPNNFSLSYDNIFLKVTGKKLSETTVPQAQPAFICSNSAMSSVEYKAKYVQS